MTTPGQFVTAAREKADDEDALPTPITLIKMEYVLNPDGTRESGKDGKPTNRQEEVDRLEAIARRPKDSIWAMLMASMSERAEVEERIASNVQFVTQCFEPEDANWIVKRLWDQEDAFDIEHVKEVVDYLMEQWSARPPTSASGSTPTPARTGARSRAHASRQAARSTR